MNRRTSQQKRSKETDFTPSAKRRFIDNPPSTSLRKWNGILCGPAKTPSRNIHSDQNAITPFELRPCALCGSLRDDTEKDLCCSNGTCIVPDCVFPDPPESFVALCDRTLNFRVASREINNRLSFAHIGTDWDHDRHPYKTGFVYRMGTTNGGSFPCMYGLHGRIFHRMGNESQHY